MAAIRSLLLLLLAGLVLAGCAAAAERTQPSLTAAQAEQAEWEERIVRTPWAVSSEYFRQRRAEDQPVLDIPQLKRSREELEAKQKEMEERVSRLESARSAAEPAPFLGYVVRVSGRRIYTDLTAGQGAAPGVRLSIFREQELKHPVSGRVLGKTIEEIGRATVVEVGEEFSAAEIGDLPPGEMIQPKDRVMIYRAER